MSLSGAVRPYVGKHGAFKLRKGGQIYSATVLESVLTYEDPKDQRIADLERTVAMLTAPKKARKKREPKPLETVAKDSQTPAPVFSLPRLQRDAAYRKISV